MAPNIAFLSLQHPIDRVRSTFFIKIGSLSRYYMYMHMRYALSRISAILSCYVQAGSIEHTLNQTADSLHSQEEVSHLRMSEIR